MDLKFSLRVVLRLQKQLVDQLVYCHVNLQGGQVFALDLLGPKCVNVLVDVTSSILQSLLSPENGLSFFVFHVLCFLE